MVFDFLQPVSKEFLEYNNTLSSQTLGKKVVFHTNDDFPEFENVDIAILCVNENRGNDQENQYENFDTLRKSFYGLFPGNWKVNIIDLGNIQAGDTIEDTYFLVKTITEDLLRKNITPIIIGGSQDLTYPIYRAYDNLDQMVNLVAIDNQFDFYSDHKSLSQSYLSKIIVEEPNNLFNFSNIGFQTYYNSQEEIDLIEKLYFEAFRLGEISNNLTLAEPVLRDANIVSLDMNSIKSSDSGNVYEFNPNGFNGKEICALARYSGISNKISNFSIFNFNNSKIESILASQIMWYFIEGFCIRSVEYPFESKDGYFKYIVPIGDEELVFYKSNKSERWWIEIPFFSVNNNKLKKSTLLPCSHDDYLAACEQEIPNRWWKAQRRNVL